MEHNPWIGDRYPEGIAGQRLLIVGYSHYTGVGEADRESLTEDVVTRVVNGEEQGSAFWSAIAGYFGREVPDFWSRVAFINFVPETIGTLDNAFARATTAQDDIGRARFIKVIRSLNPMPDKVVVFSSKAWESIPEMIEEHGGGQLPRLEVPRASFQWGTYSIAEKTVTAIGLRHPLFASGETMRAAVQSAMELPAFQQLTT